MPSVDDLARLKSLLERLSGIGGAQRGELIRAEDWNGLVDVVASLTRTQLGQEEAEKVAPHTHQDEVTVEWLVPLLRDQLQRGPLADPAMQSRLFAIEQQLRALAQQIDGQRTDLSGFHGRLTDIVTRDIVRESAVTDVTRKVGAFSDARTEVFDLRRSIGSVQRDLGSVLEAARRLEVDGQPVDLGAFAGRLNALEGFRQGFAGANGQELTGAVLEQRLAENRNQFVTQTQLDDVLRDRAGTVSPDVVEGLEGRLSANLRVQVDDSFNVLAEQIRGETNGRLNAVGDLINSRLSDAVPGIAQSVSAGLAPVIDKARQEAIAVAVTQTAENLAASERGLRAELAVLSKDLQTSFETNVKTQLAALLPGALGGLRADVAALNAKTDALGARTGQIETNGTRQAEAVALLQQEAGRQRLEMRDLLKSEVKLAVDAQNRDINARFAAIQSDLSTQLSAISRDVSQRAVDAARATATEVALNETRNARTQILAEMRQVAREEAGILVRDQIRVTAVAPVVGGLTGGGLTRPVITGRVEP